MSTNHEFLIHLNATPENIKRHIVELNSCPAIELSDCIEDRPVDQQVGIFNTLDFNLSVAVFSHLSLRTQKDILCHLPSEGVADLLNELPPDDRTNFLEELPHDLMNRLLKYLSPDERALSIKLLGYQPDSVGRLMTPDYIAIKMNWTVREVLDYIREKGHESETVNVVYAVDDEGLLTDDFRLRQFLFASLDAKVKDLSDGKFLALHVDDEQEEAINKFRKYDRVAIPVIDSKGLLLGIVTFDDIMEVASEIDTENMQKFGGVSALKEPYMDIPFYLLMRKRIGWLLVLFLGEMLTASAMGYYQDEIAQAVVLALFIPLIISSGGNAGAQATTLIIRAMALGEVSPKDCWKIMQREIFSGIFLGLALGLVGFFRVTLWSAFSDIYGAHWFLLAITLFFSLMGVILWGTLSGSMLPLALKKCGFDPAVSSAPFVATLVDVTGLIIYFSISMIILKGTLL